MVHLGRITTKAIPKLTAAKGKIFINQMARPDPASSRENDITHGVRARLRRAFARLSGFVTAAIRKLFRVTKSSPTTPGGPDTRHNFTDADVHNAMKMWNTQAKQVALAVADDLAGYFTFENADHLTQEKTSAAQRISEYIIPGLVGSLGTREPEDIIARLRPAFEACFAFAVYKAASPAAIEESNTPVKGIDETHERLQYAKSLIIEGISDILLVAGCNATLPNVMSQVTSQFHGLHASLFDIPAGPLNRVLDYTMLSDCEMFIAQPYEEFQLKCMGVDDTERQVGRVVCTTSAGLIRWVPARTGSERVVVLQALVLLESFLD